ncbi:MAG: MerR family transcriptional regulator [Rudaea sp.]
MPDTNETTAGEAASSLGISPQTLKNWSKDFEVFLSPCGPSADGARRFTADDLNVLKQVRECMAAGMTLEETADELRGAGYEELGGEAAQGGALAVTSAQQGFSVLTDTLRAMIENQQTIQNSLQVNRNLLGVIIQDNFNLKEENARLRDRMQKMEEELADVRRRDGDYRLYLEQRISRMDAAIRAEAAKSFWQRLFG